MLTSDTSRISQDGNGATTAFPYDFLILAETDLDVYLVEISTGLATLQTLTTHYTVSGVGSNSGGTVTFVTAPSSLYRVLIVRVMDLTQETDYKENNKFPAETHERALDRVTMITQQLQEVDARCIKIPLASTQSGFEIPDPDLAGSRDKALFINALGTGLEVREVSEAAFAQPLTTKGDILTHSGAGPVRQGVGANESFPEADSAQTNGWKWTDFITKLNTKIVASLFTVLTTKGDLAVSTGSTVVRKAAGSNETFLTADSSQSDGLSYIDAPTVRQYTNTQPAGYVPSVPVL